MDDLLVQALLQRATSAEPGASLNLTDLLAQTAEADPRLGMLAQLLSRRQAAAESESSPSEEIVETEVTDPEPRAPDRSQEKRQAIRQLRQKVEDLYQELEKLRERNDALAAGLGACYLCWGDDPTCPQCAGRGIPGFYQPEAARFGQMVIPAVRRVVRTKGAGNGLTISSRPHQPSNLLEQEKGEFHEQRL